MKRLLALHVVGCLFGGSANSADDHSEENQRAKNNRRQRGEEEDDTLLHLVRAHRDDREDEGDGKENKSESEDPKGAVAKQETNPASFHGRRFHRDCGQHWRSRSRRHGTACERRKRSMGQEGRADYPHGTLSGHPRFGLLDRVKQLFPCAAKSAFEIDEHSESRGDGPGLELLIMPPAEINFLSELFLRQTGRIPQPDKIATESKELRFCE